MVSTRIPEVIDTIERIRLGIVAGSIKLSDAKWLRQLGDEKAKLKRILAGDLLDHFAVKHPPGRRWRRSRILGSAPMKSDIMA
jgi:hypothetical protein